MALDFGEMIRANIETNHGHKYGLAALTAKEAQQLFVLLRKVRIAAGDLSGREPTPAPKRSRPKPAGGNHG